MQLNESSFIYEIDEPSIIQNNQAINNTIPLYQNQIVKSMNHQQSAQHPPQCNTQLLIVKPTKQVQDEQQQIQSVQIVKPNHSLKQKLTISKQQNLVFSYQESEEIEEQPQSSIRKLYKAMKRQQSTISNVEQQKVVELTSQSHLYEEQLEQEQAEQMQNKTQIRSKSLRQIVLFKVPSTKLVRCLVKIANDSFFSLQSVFHFYLVEEKQLIMTARKKRFRITSKYQIFGKTKQYVEKLAVARSNYSRTQYKLTLLNRVEYKQQTRALSSLIKITKVAQETKQATYTEDEKCYICYEPNLFGLTQQKVDIIKPKKKINQTDRFSNIRTAQENNQLQRIQKFGNRLAERDSQGKLVLDFKDNTIAYSPKNMIVQDEFGQACMLLGKKRDDLFIVDVMHPFNFLESFFVALCNLDRKLFAH